MYNLSLTYWMNSSIPCSFCEGETVQAALAAALKMLLTDKKLILRQSMKGGKQENKGLD